MILQAIGADLIDQPYAAPFLAHVEQDALIHFPNFFERGFQLVAAVTAQGANGVAGQTFRMDAHGYVLGVGHIPAHDGGVFFAVTVVVEGKDVEVSKA